MEKLIQNGSTNLNIRAKAIKFLEGNMGVTLHHFDLGHWYLDMAPKIQQNKN